MPYSPKYIKIAQRQKNSGRNAQKAKSAQAGRWGLAAALLLSLALAGCAGQNNIAGYKSVSEANSGRIQKTQPQKSGKKRAGAPYKTAAKEAGLPYSKTGRASWYGSAFHSRRTASGEIFNMHNLTAAHRSMPLPSYARVTNLRNGSSVIVRVNDRGPYSHNRLIDLSQKAAQLLGYHRGGVADVKVDYVGPAPLGGDDRAYLLASYHPANGAGGNGAAEAAAAKSAVKKADKILPFAPEYGQGTAFEAERSFPSLLNNTGGFISEAGENGSAPAALDMSKTASIIPDETEAEIPAAHIFKKRADSAAAAEASDSSARLQAD